VEWKHVVVGDLIRVESSEYFPADMLLLSSSEPEGLCYVETSNLDGETNLKIKQALPETSKILTAADAEKLKGHIKAELPSNSLYTFEGTLQLKDGPELSLSPKELLLRVSLI
jgi:phospholipid-transporting ATPase